MPAEPPAGFAYMITAVTPAKATETIFQGITAMLTEAPAGLPIEAPRTVPGSDFTGHRQEGGENARVAPCQITHSRTPETPAKATETIFQGITAMPCAQAKKSPPRKRGGWFPLLYEV